MFYVKVEKLLNVYLTHSTFKSLSALRPNPNLHYLCVKSYISDLKNRRCGYLQKSIWVRSSELNLLSPRFQGAFIISGATTLGDFWSRLLYPIQVLSISFLVDPLNFSSWAFVINSLWLSLLIMCPVNVLLYDLYDIFLSIQYL